jgi:hypothetical protein
MADKTYLVRGYYPGLGFRYWYSSTPINLLAEYPAADSYYPADTSQYTDIIIYDAIPFITETTAEIVQVPILWDLVSPPTYKEVVVLTPPSGGIEYVTPGIANVQLTRVVGIAASTANYVQIGGVASVKTWTDGYDGYIVAGDEVYLSDGYVGAITKVAPSTPGCSIAPIGVALADESDGVCIILLDIKEPMYLP